MRLFEPDPFPRASRPSSSAASRSVVATQPVSPEGRVYAKVNRRVDVLENERSHYRISDAAYSTGRIVQAVFERARGPRGGGQWCEGDRVDAAAAHEIAIIKGIDSSRQIVGMLRRIRSAVGRIDANLLQAILGDNKSFAEVAAMLGRAGPRGAAYVATRFRDALDELADQWAARGKRSGGILAWAAPDDEPTQGEPETPA